MKALPAAHRSTSERAFLRCGALLALLAQCPGAFAAEISGDLIPYTHMAWATSVGLQGKVRSIAQTADGYLWLGTEFGLVRFDGVSFVPTRPGVGPPVGGVYTRSVLAARDGTLWIGTINGLTSWRDGRSTEYPELAGKLVMSLLEDHTGTVWAGGPGGLCAIQSGRTRCDQIESDGRQSGIGALFGDRGDIVYSLYEDSNNRLWAGTESGLWQWTPGPPHRYAAQAITVQQALVPGEHGKAIVAITGGEQRALQQIKSDGMEPYQIPGLRPSFQAEALLRDHRGALWIGTIDQGLWRVQDGAVTHFSQENGLSGNLVSALFEDREGSIWVGTINGLDRFRESAGSIISTNQGLSAPVGCVLAARDGSLWIGTHLGLNRWLQARMTRYRATPAAPSIPTEEHQNGSVRHEATEITDPGLQDNAIDALYEDPHGRIWVGTNRGVSSFDNGKFTPLRGAPRGIPTVILGDAHDGLWISYPAFGLSHVLNGSVVESVPWPWTHQGRDFRVSAVLPDSMTGGVWVGFWDGGLSLLKDGQVQTSLKVKDGLGAGTVWGLHFDGDHTLWASTEGGLSRIRDGRVMTLTTKNGLPCDAVHWIIEDHAISWVNTACGLLRIDRAKMNAWASDSQASIHPIVFDRADGIQRHAFAAFSPVVTRSVDGQLWFAHWDGITGIDPLHLPINRVVPPVHIEQILADGQIYLPTSALRLPARLRDISIDYTALSLVDPDKVRFRYKLEGQDPDWREVLNIRRVQYSNLAPGSYRFRVIAANNSGFWNQEGASVDFAIAPAYWQTNWFRGLCGAILLFVLWVLYRLRLRQIARVFNARLEERVAERTRIARDLHDTLLQSFQGLLLRFQTVREALRTRPAEVDRILEISIDQTAQAINEGREAVQGLRTSTVETNDLAVALTKLGEDLATEANSDMSVQLHTEVEGTPRGLHPIVRDEIYRVSSEALRNAFRHARAKRIEAELRYDEKEFRLRIRDDGKGIDPTFLTAEGRTGHFGLHGMRERATLMGGKLAVWTAVDSGTEIELRIPAARAYAASNRRSWFAERFSGKSAQSRS
ncbi:MAG TPA: two-component regulator propeller domain-containing protein [Steroidobacteraceae bacterium]|nr:two-component regulator propeller domain-containing protein [Steroidobacteraceae bacterium]